MNGIRVAIQGVFCVCGLFLMWRLLFPRRPPARERTAEPRPRISVVIPARNEAHQIARLLRSLQGQTVPPAEVLVVDDSSTDDTEGAARQEGVTVIPGEPLPAGWNGKAWACWQGAAASSGDLLLFLDADTWLEPTGVEQLCNLYQGRGLLTVQPYHVTEKPYEQLSAFFNIVIMAATGAFTPLGERLPPGGGFGPCVVCRREEYLRTGGHREVRGEPLEDIPLTKLFRRHGLPVRCHAGRGIVSFRMYPGGLGEVIQGWSKGMGYGAFAVHPAMALMATAWITGCFSACALLVRTTIVHPTATAWLGLLPYGVYALVVAWMLRGIGRFRWWTSAFFALPLCFFALVIARSLLQTYLLGRVTWKGRAVRTARRRK